jgi:superfamily II DNA or RNA helicase
MKLRNYQISLICDTRHAFYNYNRPLVVLPCGAGKTVCFADMAHKHIEKHNGLVWFLVHRQELIDQTRATFNEFNIPEDNIFIGMVQTITRHPERYQKPTLIIFDEAHHAKAKSWYNIINYFKDVPMIGLTATPIRRDGKALGDIFDVMVEGVDAKTLTKQGYLAEYDYYAPHIDKMEYHLKGTDYDLNDVTAQLLKSKIYGNIEKYIDHNRKTIIYCPSIMFSKALCERTGAVHFDGDTPKIERKRIVKEFKEGKIRILSNVDLIGEGFDVPDCDTVILLRPTMSLSLYIQQSMRCLRPAPNKKAIIYDLVGNCYRHGLPTESREWSLTKDSKVVNGSGEPDIIVRRCHNCELVYSGIQAKCPYCGYNNGKTPRQIEEEHQIELEKIEKIERKKAKREVGMARNEAQLIEIGKKRGYKNPQYWAKMIINSRKRRI